MDKPKPIIFQFLRISRNANNFSFRCKIAKVALFWHYDLAGIQVLNGQIVEDDKRCFFTGFPT